MWIIAINGEEPITSQGILDELNNHQNQRGIYRVNISLRRRKIYHRIDLGYICSRFDQFRPVVSHLGVCLPEKPPTTKNIGEV